MILLVFGVLAVGVMLVAYALEERSHWFVLGFAGASAAAALYGALIEAWPFAALEAVWSLVALRRWWRRRTGVAGALTGQFASRVLGRSG